MAVNDTVCAVVRDIGTPAYIYFLDEIRQRVADLRGALGGQFQISYAVKCNPNPGLLKRMADMVDMLDVSSGGEVERALGAGWDGARLSFTGPGKTAAELKAAMRASIGVIVVESVDEAELLNELASASRKRARILVRIGPSRMPRGFGMSMSGKPSQFGIDAEDLQPAVRTILGMPNLDWAGFHIYSGSQCLKAEAIVENYEIFVDLFRDACAALDLQPSLLIFGSGLGIPYYESDIALDLKEVGNKTVPILDELKADKRFARSQLVLETGRYLVGQAGVYVTRVIRTKRSRGVDIAICDGGMNHHLAAAGHLGSMIQRNYRMHAIATRANEGSATEYTVVGPLCATIDVLGRKVKLPPLAKGDLLVLESSGAYGVSASPIHFLSHPAPKEVIVESIGGKQVMEDATQFTVGASVR